MTPRNRQIHLAAYPAGLPQPDNFRMVETGPPALQDGQALVRVAYLSMDPFPRLRLRPDAAAPLPLHTVMDGRGVGWVMDSRHPDVAVGDWVAGDVGWQDYAALPGAALTKLDPALGPLHRFLSLLGPSGLTGYFTVLADGVPSPGGTVVVAPAAGSVGTVAGQIAKLHGCRVVGIAGGVAQCAFLEQELGFDRALDHHAPDFAAALAAACPRGVDLFIDGVGGALHDQVMERINSHARIVLLGFISGYNQAAPPAYGRPLQVLFKRAVMRGFLLADYQARFAQAQRALAQWHQSGQVRPVENIWQGLDQAPAAFAALFADAKPGKQLVCVASPPTAKE